MVAALQHNQSNKTEGKQTRESSQSFENFRTPRGKKERKTGLIQTHLAGQFQKSVNTK
jgi:hypothetical protein